MRSHEKASWTKFLILCNERYCHYIIFLPPLTLSCNIYQLIFKSKIMRLKNKNHSGHLEVVEDWTPLKITHHLKRRINRHKQTN